MRSIGFSTGALALGDFRRALAMLSTVNSSAIELSALRDHELDPLMRALSQLNLRRFRYVSVHVPSKSRGPRGLSLRLKAKPHTPNHSWTPR